MFSDPGLAGTIVPNLGRCGSRGALPAPPLNMGMGDTIDRSKTTRLLAGSVAVIPAKTNHFSWTSEETVVQVHGIGPLVIHYVNAADDPRKK